MEIKEGVKVAFGGDASGLLSAANLGKAGVAGLVTYSVAKMAEFDRAARQTQRQWERSMTEISTLSNFTAKEIKQMRDGMADLTTSFGQLFDKVARARYDTISAGFTDAAESAAVLEAAANGAVGGLTDISVSAKALTTILNSYNMKGRESSRVNDLLFATVQQGVTTYGELASEIGEVASTAHAAGVPLEELLALIATVTRGGISTPEAITAINQFLLASIKQGPEARRIFKAFNIDLTNMADAMVKISTISDRDLEVLAKLVPSVRGLKAAVAGAAEDGERFAEVLAAIQDSEGAGIEAAKKMGSTLEQLNKIDEATVERFKAVWGEFTAPGEEAVLNKRIDFFKEATRFVEKLNSDGFSAMDKLLYFMGGAAGAAGEVIPRMGTRTAGGTSTRGAAVDSLWGWDGAGVPSPTSTSAAGPVAPAATVDRARTALEQIAWFQQMVAAGQMQGFRPMGSTFQRGERFPGESEENFDLGGGGIGRAGAMTWEDFAENAPAAYVQGAGDDPWAEASRKINTINRVANATVGNLATSIRSGIGNELVKAFGGGESAVARFAASAVADIAQVIAEAVILRAILDTIGMGGIADALGLAKLFSEGGYVPGFAWGGYTGGAIDKHQVAGVVHAGEYVLNAQATAAIGRHNLDRLNRGGDTYNVNLGGVTVNSTSRESAAAIADELELALPRALRKINQTGAARVATGFGG